MSARFDPITATGAACAYCGCTEDDACVLNEPVTCRWYREPDHNGFAVCSNPDCVKKYLADPGAP